MRLLVVLALLTLAGAARAEGGVHPLCEEGRADDELGEPLPLTAPAAAILPCAMVDSGLLQDGGTLACADTPFYVVTHAGVLLCQVDVEWFAATAAPALERAPSAAAPSSSAAHAAAAVSTLEELATPWPVELRASANAGPRIGPRDATTWRPPRPS